MSAITVLNRDNVPTGPFTREQIAGKLQSGELNLDQLAFVEGLAQWTPLRAVLAQVDAASMPPPPPATPLHPPGTAAAASYRHDLTTPSGEPVYAGFWLRFVAYILDNLIITIPLSFLSGIAGGIFGATSAAMHPGEKPGFVHEDGSLDLAFVLFELCVIFVTLIVTWLYFAFQESSAAQATIGKRVLSLKVTSDTGARLSFGHASGRFFGKILSGLILYIGFFMAGFTEKKQALHDMIAGTLVVRS
jgi:uncharacterized RDD family membrane protein YckC